MSRNNPECRATRRMKFEQLAVGNNHRQFNRDSFRDEMLTIALKKQLQRVIKDEKTGIKAIAETKGVNPPCA